MKPLLAFSILLNLAFGGVLVYRAVTPAIQVSPVLAPASAQEAKAKIARPQHRRAVGAASATPTRHGSNAAGDWEGTPKDLYALLKAAGAPPEVILTVMGMNSQAVVSKKMLELMYPNGMNRWSAAMRSNSELRQARVALNREANDEVRELMRVDYERASMLASPVAAIKWGNLSDQALLTVANIHQKYNDTLGASRANPGEPRAATADASYEKAIRAALSPAEAEDFLTYNSGPALALQRELARVNAAVDEDQYKTLLKVNNAIGASYGSVVPSQMAEAYAAILGNEQALSIVTNRNPAFGRIDGLLTSSGVDAEARLGLYHDYLEASRAMESPRGANQQVPAAAAAFYNNLAAKVPPQQLAAFLKTPGGKFLAPYGAGGP